MDYTKLAIFSQFRESYDGGQARRYNFAMNLKTSCHNSLSIFGALCYRHYLTPLYEFDALHPNNRHFGSQNAVKKQEMTPIM